MKNVNLGLEELRSAVIALAEDIIEQGENSGDAQTQCEYRFVANKFKAIAENFPQKSVGLWRFQPAVDAMYSDAENWPYPDQRRAGALELQALIGADGGND